LANGGLCPLTHKRVFEADAVRRVLPIMLTCGMYDYSGEWAYSVGVPSKSGVAGCVFMVVPNVCGISIWSPRLDDVGNSVRGVAAAHKLAEYITFHNFEIFANMGSPKLNPTEPRDAQKHRIIGEIVFGAGVGDLNCLKYWKENGVNLYSGDYDFRTALHLAASEGNADVLAYLIENTPSDTRAAVISSVDRWGNTPLDDALEQQRDDCIEILRAAGARSLTYGKQGASKHALDFVQSAQEADVAGAIWAAADGCLTSLIQVNASGRCRDIFAGDYDSRTALHLAASEGHVHVVRYLLAQVPKRRKLEVLSFVDRFGNTPLQEAQRGQTKGHLECVSLLKLALQSV